MFVGAPFGRVETSEISYFDFNYDRSKCQRLFWGRRWGVRRAFVLRFVAEDTTVQLHTADRMGSLPTAFPQTASRLGGQGAAWARGRNRFGLL